MQKINNSTNQKKIFFFLEIYFNYLFRSSHKPLYRQHWYRIVTNLHLFLYKAKRKKKYKEVKKLNK